MIKNTWILIALSLLFSVSAFGQMMNEMDIKKLRNMTSRDVIKVGPESNSGKGIKNPGAAMSALKKGNVLQIAEGSYSTVMAITEDEVIIEPMPGADPQKIYNCRLRIAGKNVIVRGLNLDRIFISKDVDVIDCFIRYADIAGNTRRRADIIRFYNCVISNISVERGETGGRNWGILIAKVGFQNCVLGFQSYTYTYTSSTSSSAHGAIDIYPNVSFTFKQCIMYAKSLFTLGWAFMENNGKITVENSLMHATDVLAQLTYTRRSTDKKTIARDIKELKRNFSKNFNLKGKIVFEAPVFSGNATPQGTRTDYIDEDGRERYTYRYGFFDFANLTLKEGSPGTEIKGGIGLASVFNGFPGVDNSNAAGKDSGSGDDDNDSSSGDNNSGNDDDDDDW